MEVIVAKDADLQPGTMMAVEVNERKLVLFKDKEGRVSALQDRCSHAEVRLSVGKYDAESAQVECAAHGARFNIRTGKNLCMPAVTPVKSFQAKIIDGNIVVEL